MGFGTFILGVAVGIMATKAIEMMLKKRITSGKTGAGGIGSGNGSDEEVKDDINDQVEK